MKKGPLDYSLGLARKPLRTGHELAEEFGVSIHVFAYNLKSFPDAPQPKLDNRRNSKAAKFLWYDPDEVREWWKKQDFKRTGHAHGKKGQAYKYDNDRT